MDQGQHRRPTPPTSEQGDGTRLSFTELVQAHEETLYRYALRLCHDASDARDLVQDTFERSLLAYQPHRLKGTGESWLVTILRNLFINRCRAARRELLGSMPYEEIQGVAMPEPEPTGWSSVTMEQVRAAVARLPPVLRTIYELRELEGRSYAEIARITGIPCATVGTRLARARRQLKQLLCATPEQ